MFVGVCWLLLTLTLTAGPFKTFSLGLKNLGEHGSAAVADVFCNTKAAAGQGVWPRDAIRAGPLANCGEDMECKYSSGAICRAYLGQHTSDPSVFLSLKPGRKGNSLTRFSAPPAHVRYQFPAMGHPATVTLRYRVDKRYNSNLFGGNPCSKAKATPGYKCDICVDNTVEATKWDYASKPGFFVLWSAAGRDGYLVTGPHMPTCSSQHNPTKSCVEHDLNNGLVSSPAALKLQDGEQLVVVFVVYSQYVEKGRQDDESGAGSFT